MEKKESRSEINNKSGKIIILLCVVVIILLVAAIVLLLSKKGISQSAVESTEQKRNVVVNEKNAEEIAEELASDDYVEPGYYTVNMATEWHFTTGDAISDNARVDNVAGNTNPVYFDLFLAENEEEPIYQSPVIPVGSFLENIILDQPLSAGSYDCVMVYHLVDDEQKTISTLRVAIQIIIES